MRTASSSLLAFAAVLVSCTSEYDLTGERPDVDPGEVTECGFTGVSGTYISSYDCNPVFTTTGEVHAADVGSVVFHTTEVLGHPFYQIWYVGFPEGGGYGTYSLGYAVSGDGTTWDTHPQNPLVASEGGNAWDRDIMDGVQIVWDDSGSRYVASYQGARVGTDPTFDPSFFGLGILTSPDGVTWTKHPGNPVIDFTADPFAVEPRVCWPLSLTSSGGAFRSYIAASSPSYDPFSDPDCSDPIFLSDPNCNAPCELHTATAVDLAIWQTSQNATMRADQWYEKRGVASAAIAELDGTQYLFYISFERWEQVGADIISATGLHFKMATSTDGGLTWVKDPNNPLDVLGNVTPSEVRAVGAQTVGRRIHFWITDTYPDLGQAGVGYFILEPDLETPHP